MIDLSFGAASPDALGGFETQLGWRLPSEYREFLSQKNGGRVKPNNRYLADSRIVVTIDVLFGLGIKPGLDLQEWHRKFLQELPRDMMIIGGDLFGNFFVLGLLDKVYFWDHIRKLERSSDSGNAYLVCEGFDRFLSGALSPKAGHFEDIRGPKGSKLPESIWYDLGGGKLQEIDRKTYIEFSRHEGFRLFDSKAQRV